MVPLLIADNRLKRQQKGEILRPMHGGTTASGRALSSAYATGIPPHVVLSLQISALKVIQTGFRFPHYSY